MAVSDDKSVQSAKEGSSLGDLIDLFYKEFLELYGDEELASVAAAAAINELMADQSNRPEQVGDN